MNTVFKIFLSMSFSGAVLVLALLAGKRFWRDKISRQWQYYIWLVVILRLLLPFAPERNLMAAACQAVEQMLSGTTLSVPPQPMTDIGDVDIPISSQAPDSENAENADNAVQENENMGNHIWLVWLAVVFGLLIRKITMYQSFVRYIKDGCIPVNDIAMLERFSDIAAQTGIKKTVELCVNPLVSSPMLIGFFRPCIVLPCAEISEKDFHYIALHELMHHKRRDILYKWLVQITVCLHWFNPMVYRMRREITRACEFSCDAAVLAKVGKDHAPEYGKTLLDAMAAVRTYRENFGAVTLSENKQLLKERLVAVMNVRKKSKAAVMLTGVMTLCLIFGAAFMGVYPAAAAQPDSTKERRLLQNGYNESSLSGARNADSNDGQNSFLEKEDKATIASQAEQYYEAGSFPMFQIVFSRLDEKAKDAWLNRIYADGQFMFLGAVASQLEIDSAHIQHIAEKAYTDNSIIFFSIVAKRMSEKTLKTWLDMAQADGKSAFQFMLLDLLDDDELDATEEELEKQLESAQVQEYLEHGIVSDGNLKTFYYESQLVHVFLDIRKEKSFYFLQVNPQGTVNVKVTRDENNHIKSVDYMTDAEVAALFGDMKEEENDEYEASVYDVPQIISVNEQRIAAGAKLWFGDYDLCSGDKIQYNIEAETGDAIMVGFVNNADGRFSDTTYCSALVHREDGVLKCTADFVCGEPVKDGQYKLYLYAPENALGNVKGSVSIVHGR